MSTRDGNTSGEAAASASSGVIATAQLQQQQQQQQQPILTLTQVSDLCSSEPARLHADDIERLRIGFSSQTAACFVCPCPAAVCLRVDAQTPEGPCWRLVHTSGALVLMMPSFRPEERDARSDLLFVDPGACLALWKLPLTSGTQHSQTHLLFQTVSDPTARSIYGLAFAEQHAATEFGIQVVARLREMSKFESASAKERQKAFKEHERRGKSLRRMLSRSKSSGSSGFSEISNPCICQRLASATAQDCDRLSEVLAMAATDADRQSTD